MAPTYLTILVLPVYPNEGAANTMVAMTNDEHIQRHLEICQRVYERLVAEGKWPWPDSQLSENLVESRNLNDDI